MQRNLAAVLAADVVGYSRLMGEDAAKTLAALRRLRAELFGPAVAGYRGTLVKSMGDGWIVTFASAVDAVTCAMRLQDRMVVEPDISLRIGIHIGDITFEDEDVFGDGVNVAARLETLCEPGGLGISDAVFSTLDGTLRPAFDDAGEHSLKNIARPLRVWTRGGFVGAGVVSETTRKAGFPVLNIVPVSVSDMRDEVRGLAHALTHDLETYLGALRWLRISVAREPESGAVTLTADLRASGDRLRLESRLTAPDGAVLWRGKHDGQLGDAFDWQDQTGSDVASHAVAAISAWQSAVRGEKPQADWTWQDWVILAQMGGSVEIEGMTAGLNGLARAIALSPPSSYPYEIMLALIATASSLGYGDLVAKYGPHFEDWAKIAREMAGPATSSRIILAFSSYVRTGDEPTARKDISAVLRDMPFDPDVLIFGGYLFQFLGEPENALACFRRFDDVGLIDAYRPGIRSGTGASYVQMGRFEEALVEFGEAIRLAPGYTSAYRWRVAALAHLGRLDEARDALAEHDLLLPGQTVTSVRAGSRYADTPGLKLYFDGMRMAGMPD